MTPESTDRRGLALVGLRGTGKSTVGRIVADRLGRPFADADKELEATVREPIRDLFAGRGEAAFRDLERGVLSQLTESDDLILATGGGVVLLEANRMALKRFGFVVWLTAGPETLADRLRADSKGVADRPALTPAGTLAELADVLEARSPLYREVADAIVDTTGRTPEQVAEAVLEAWSRDGRAGEV